MSSRQKKLQGILPAPITPFASDGSIDFDLFGAHIDYLAAAGVDGFFVAGTTGEGALLSSEERCRLFETMIEHTRDDHVRCVVVLQPDTAGVLRGIDDLLRYEPDFVSAVTPYYLGVKQSEIVGHYERIANHSPVPVVLYNIPQNTHNAMSLETILELAQHPNIAGIKDSSGDFLQFQRGLLSQSDPGFTWIQGEDLLDAPSLLLGARCVVTGLGNAWAEPYVAMFQAARRSDADAVIAEQRKINSLARIISQTDGRVIQAIKGAAAIQGRSTHHMRVPSMDLSGTGVEAVRRVLREIGLA